MVLAAGVLWLSRGGFWGSVRFWGGADDFWWGSAQGPRSQGGKTPVGTSGSVWDVLDRGHGPALPERPTQHRHTQRLFVPRPFVSLVPVPSHPPLPPRQPLNFNALIPPRAGRSQNSGRVPVDPCLAPCLSLPLPHSRFPRFMAQLGDARTHQAVPSAPLGPGAAPTPARCAARCELSPPKLIPP